MRHNRLTHSQLRELESQKEKEVVQGYRRLKDLWSGMLAEEEGPEREWMLEAEKLVDMFRETRNLFLTSRVCCHSIILIQQNHRRIFPQANPFRGMFPRSRTRKRQRTEIDEDNMASRLQLDLGTYNVRFSMLG